MTQKVVGLIGIGLLGSALARRLISRNFDVHGYDISSDATDRFRSFGGSVCSCAASVVDRASTILLSLPDSDASTDVIAHLADHIQSQTVIVDTTTGSPVAMESNGRTVVSAGGIYLEATVAGSSQQAEAGEATYFVGGDEGQIEGVQTLLKELTSRQFHTGVVGSASRMRLVHNLVLGLNRAVLAEGLTFAESLGFDSVDVLNILKQTPAASGVMETKGEKMATGNYAPVARLSQHLKDVRLILEMANGGLALSETHAAILQKAEELGFGDSDNSAVIEAIRSAADKSSPGPDKHDDKRQ